MGPHDVCDGKIGKLQQDRTRLKSEIAQLKEDMKGLRARVSKSDTALSTACEHMAEQSEYLANAWDDVRRIDWLDSQRPKEMGSGWRETIDFAMEEGESDDRPSLASIMQVETIYGFGVAPKENEEEEQ